MPSTAEHISNGGHQEKIKPEIKKAPETKAEQYLRELSVLDDAIDAIFDPIDRLEFFTPAVRGTREKLTAAFEQASFFIIDNCTRYTKQLDTKKNPKYKRLIDSITLFVALRHTYIESLQYFRSSTGENQDFLDIITDQWPECYNAVKELIANDILQQKTV